MTQSEQRSAMRREDWVAVGLQLYGLYLLCQGLLGFPVFVGGFRMASLDSNPEFQLGLVLNYLLQWVVGLGLVLMAGRLARGVSRGSDPAARSTPQKTPARPAERRQRSIIIQEPGDQA